MATTEQVPRNGKSAPNPTGKGGFSDHPENRNPGGWNKEESISYQYNRIGRMSDKEFEAFKPTNKFQKIALARIRAAENEKYGLPDSKEITDRTEGKAPQAIDITTGGEKVNVLQVEFVNGNSQDSDKTS